MRTYLLLAALAASSLSCGDDVDVCPTGSCDLPGSTVIKWKFNSYPDRGFDSDACTEVGVSTVRVELIGVDDPTVVMMSDTGCGEGQKTFVDLPLQNYAVSVTPLDASGTSLVKMPATGSTPAGTTGVPAILTVNVAYELWTQQYTGQFLYRVTWGGVTCAAATPPVAKQNIKLTTVTGVTTLSSTDGEKLDGTTPFNCYASTQQFPQNVQNLPFGPATIEIVGLDAAMAKAYEKTFQTFIGAGTFNPTLTYDVPLIDAAVPSDI